MIIGISGKIKSGKDTVAEIIQYLLFRANKHEIGLDNSFEEFREIINKEWSKEEITIETSFEIRKFADKLKDIICILIGCTREQLENHEFKDTPLGEEWTRYAYAVGHKDVYLNGKFSKEMIHKFCTKEIYEYEKSVNWQTAYKSELTPRLLLQLIGTECGRNIIHPNIWINALFADYKPKNAPYKHLGDLLEDKHNGLLNLPNWIITDVRFPNEAKAIKDKGGIVIRIKRPCEECGVYNNITCNKCSHSNLHESETALDNYNDFNYIVTNDSDIPTLVEKIKEILIKEKIL